MPRNGLEDMSPQWEAQLSIPVCQDRVFVSEFLICAGKFDWRESGRFPGFTEPTENYHDLVYLDRFGPLAYIVKVRAEMMRDIGACVNPFGSFLLLQGLETLSLRGHRHCTNAMELARSMILLVSTIYLITL